MDKRSIQVEGTKSPVLSAAVASHGLLFISGQTAGEETGFDAQARAVLSKIRHILETAGLDLSSVVRCGVYLADIRFRNDLNRIYPEYFTEPRPARTTIECKLAEPAVLVEIDCVATLS